MVLSSADVAALSELFDASETVPLQQRSAWLDALPPTQRHLVPMLRAMLMAPESACRAPDSVWPLPALALDAEPSQAAQAAEAANAADMRVGPYRLIRQIGHGGMGSVWLAERADGSFDRRVALKLPRLPHLTRGLPERMASERRIGARLEHPHIARLYDAGVDAAQRPYMAFQYIDGEPVHAWCRARNCGVQQTLRVFVQAIRAVAYAHRQLVVHRDLKPANILVDGQGHAYLLDFGIAKLLEEVSVPAASLTREYGLAMTRRYASPEQIAGTDIGTASDIYSLGVTLYEVLTGASPYVLPQQTVSALDSAILRGDTAPASSRAGDQRLQRALRGDIDAILWKALQRKPEQRFLSADAMADDIDHVLAGRPISIRHAPWLERGRRFFMRHSAGLLVAGVAAAAVATVTGVLLQQTRRTADEAERARMVTEFTEGLFLLQMLPAGPPEAGRSRAAALDAVSALIDARFAGRPDVQADLYGAMARVYTDIGVGKLASASAEKQVQLLRRSGAGAERMATAHLSLAAANARQGRNAQAEQQARDAVAALPDAAPEAGLEARAVLAGLLLPSGRAAEAAAIFTALEAALPLAQRRNSTALARTLEAQGVLMEIDNRFDGAVQLWRQAVQVGIAAEGADSRTAARVRLRMAAEYLARNQLAAARASFEPAVAALRRLGNSGKVQAEVAASKFAAEAFSMGLMDHAEASAWLNTAHDTVAGWGPALPAEVLANIDILRGVLALRRQDLATAAGILERAVPIAREATDSAIAQRWLVVYTAALAMASGQHPRADGLLRERLALRVKAGDGATPFAAYDWVQLSHNALMQGDIASAKATLVRAPSFKPLNGDVHASGLTYANARAEQWARIRLYEGDAKAALAVMPAPYGLEAGEDRSEPTLAPYALRGEVLCAAGQPAAGLPVLLASIGAIEPALHPAAPALARLRALAGRCALLLGDRAGALRLASLSGQAFLAQPAVSSWYRLPLDSLQHALHMRRRPG